MRPPTPCAKCALTSEDRAEAGESVEQNNVAVAFDDAADGSDQKLGTSGSAFAALDDGAAGAEEEEDFGGLMVRDRCGAVRLGTDGVRSLRSKPAARRIRRTRRRRREALPPPTLTRTRHPRRTARPVTRRARRVRSRSRLRTWRTRSGVLSRIRRRGRRTRKRRARLRRTRTRSRLRARHQLQVRYVQ